MPVNPLFQVQLIVAGNLVIAASVVTGILVGKFANPTIPPGFWVPEVVIVLIGVAIAFTNVPEHISAWAAQTKYTPSKGIVRWEKRRAPALPVLVYVFSGVALFALAALVDDTGGVVASPFVPFLTTPALFGPFVAKRKSAAFFIVVVVAVVVFGLTLQVHTKPTTRCLTTECAASALKAEHNAPAAPSQWLYSSVTGIVLLVAGAIGALRLGREEKLLAWIRAEPARARDAQQKAVDGGGEERVPRDGGDIEPQGSNEQGGGQG